LLLIYGLNIVVTPVGSQPEEFSPIFRNLGNSSLMGNGGNYMKLNLKLFIICAKSNEILSNVYLKG